MPKAPLTRTMGIIASPSKPSVRLTALLVDIITKITKGIKNMPKSIITSLKKGIINCCS